MEGLLSEKEWRDLLEEIDEGRVVPIRMFRAAARQHSSACSSRQSRDS